jgi:hypothetical protein
MVIDAHFTEFIDDYRYPAAVVSGQYPVQQRGFART